MRLLTMIVASALLLAETSPSWSQGSGSSRLSPPPSAQPQTPQDFYRSFWRHLNRREAPYRGWQALLGKDQPQPAEPPHGPFVRVLANSVAAQDLPRPAHGAILVAEDYDQDRKTLRSISVLYRVRRHDPQHYDWYWLRYRPDGSLDRAPREQGSQPIAGRVTTCIECHRKAKGDDLLFSNDNLPSPPGQ